MAMLDETIIELERYPKTPAEVKALVKRVLWQLYYEYEYHSIKIRVWIFSTTVRMKDLRPFIVAMVGEPQWL